MFLRVVLLDPRRDTKITVLEVDYRAINLREFQPSGSSIVEKHDQDVIFESVTTVASSGAHGLDWLGFQPAFDV